MVLPLTFCNPQTDSPIRTISNIIKIVFLTDSGLRLNELNKDTMKEKKVYQTEHIGNIEKLLCLNPTKQQSQE